MQDKILQLLKRFDEVEAELGLPECLANQKKYKELAQEHAYLTQVKEVYESLQKIKNSFKQNKEMLSTLQDEEFEALVKEEIQIQEKEIQDFQKKLESLLVPPNPDDHKNIILELRAGTGGDEAAILLAIVLECTSCMPQKKDGRLNFYLVHLQKWVDSKSI